MTVYYIRYATEDEKAFRNEAFTNKVDAKKRFVELKKNAAQELKEYEDNGSIADFPPTEMFDRPFESYLNKVTVKKTSDLIKLINSL